MENSIYIALSKQMALRNQMDATANNIANMNTTGYRGQHVLFNEYLQDDSKGVEDELSFVLDKGQWHSKKEGDLKYTGNQTDIAIEGPGYFGMVGPGGEVMYTRAGQLQMDANGVLTDANGRPIASTGGAQIALPAGSSEVKIDENGFVSNQNGQVGQIMVVEFTNQQQLDPVGNNLYRTDEEGQPPANSRVKQGMLEGSNVNAVEEMTAMIGTLRDYQSVQNALKTEHERLRAAIQSLTQQ
ncbi:MAG: flagellar basal-body rod protein FlgF [Micavibrio sp.]|nr:flagellar basal-body rod protein FlgF [Micavibrio sp.]